MSTAVALTPRVRIMVICDEVRKSRTEAGVFHLKGVRQEISAEAFPFVPSKLWLFLLLSNPRAGSFPGYVRVVNEKTDRVVYHAHLEPRPIFGASGGTFSISVPIRCTFPETGAYRVQVWFFQEQGSDVLKGELPFLTLTEGSEP
jgi:hypothetical protein